MSVSTTEVVVTATLTTEADTIPVAFPFTSASDLTVKNLTTNTVLGLGVDYSVAGGGVLPGGGYDTGSVTIIDTSVTTSNQEIEVRRATPRTQDTEYVPGGRFSSTGTETALDKLTLIDQELNEDSFSRVGFGDVSGSGVYGTNSLDADAWRSDADLKEDLEIVANPTLDTRLTAFENAALMFFGTSIVANEADLAAAISAANAAPTTTFRRTTTAKVPITGATVIPDNLTFVIPPETGFTFPVSQTLQIHGEIMAGNYQIFWGSFAVGDVYGRWGSKPLLNPMWWGAKRANHGDLSNSTDSTLAFKCAINGHGADLDSSIIHPVVLIPEGNWRITEPLDCWNSTNYYAEPPPGVRLVGQKYLDCKLWFDGVASYCLAFRRENVGMNDVSITCGGANYGIILYDNVSEGSEFDGIGVTQFALTGIDISNAVAGTGTSGFLNLKRALIGGPTAANATAIDMSGGVAVGGSLEYITIIDTNDRWQDAIKTTVAPYPLRIRHVSVEGFRRSMVYVDAGAKVTIDGLSGNTSLTDMDPNAACIWIAATASVHSVRANHVRVVDSLGESVKLLHDLKSGKSIGPHVSAGASWNLWHYETQNYPKVIDVQNGYRTEIVESHERIEP